MKTKLTLTLIAVTAIFALSFVSINTPAPKAAQKEKAKTHVYEAHGLESADAL